MKSRKLDVLSIRQFRRYFCAKMLFADFVYLLCVERYGKKVKIKSDQSFKAGMSNSNCSAGHTFSFEQGKIISGQQNLRM
jgi:hypothetical protein